MSPEEPAHTVDGKLVTESNTPPGERKHSPACACFSVIGALLAAEKILHDPKHVLLYVTRPKGAAAQTGHVGCVTCCAACA